MIVGAGLAGLIAAHVFPQLPIVESRPEPQESHKALLRFRSAAVGELVGVEFRPVTVRKGVWLNGDWEEPNIRAANMYSQKVLGKIIDRSIWDTSTVTRWIAPEDLYDRLIDSVGQRIWWSVPWDYATNQSVISTAPMPAALTALGMSHPEFRRAPITVRRFRIPDCDAFQTVYYPSGDHTMYRASITGDLLICEFAGEPQGEWMADVQHSLRVGAVDPIGEVEQRYGKIAPIDEGVRKALIAKLTQDHNVFSLGRFATWRNILLDDVVHDAAVVKRLMTMGEYDRKLRSL